MTPQDGVGEFSLHHYVCLKSIRRQHPGHEVVLWYGYEPTANPYWREAAKFCKLIQVEAPTEIFGNPLTIHAHRTDVLRLQVLNEYGGIYVDLDSILAKPLDDIFIKSTMMALEVDDQTAKVHGLCNALIFAMPRSSFIRRWLDSFEFFMSGGHDAAYAFFGVRLPLILARQRSDDIDIVSHRLFFPFWCDSHGLKKIFAFDTQLPVETRSIHLWESQANKRGHIQAITPASIFSVPTLYNRLAARYVTLDELAPLAAEMPTPLG